MGFMASMLGGHGGPNIDPSAFGKHLRPDFAATAMPPPTRPTPGGVNVPLPRARPEGSAAEERAETPAQERAEKGAKGAKGKTKEQRAKTRYEKKPPKPTERPDRGNVTPPEERVPEAPPWTQPPGGISRALTESAERGYTTGSEATSASPATPAERVASMPYRGP